MLTIESEFLNADIYSWFNDIHTVVCARDPEISSTRHYVKVINTFRSIFNKKRGKIIDRQKHLKVNFKLEQKSIYYCVFNMIEFSHSGGIVWPT